MFLSLEDPRWRQFLTVSPHDVYHTPQYLHHASRHEDGLPCAFYAEDGTARLLIPLLLRDVPKPLGADAGWRDAASPYGYAGPLFSQPGHAASAKRLWSEFLQTAAKENLVSVFLRWHPLFPPPADAGEEFARIDHGQTVYVDLTAPEDQLQKQVRQGHRYEIRRLLREGYRVVMNDWSHYPPFIDLYQQTMRRVGAGSSYFFPPAYFHDLKELLADRLHLGSVLSPPNELVSASLFTETAGVVQYHLSATATEHLRKSPAKLLLDHVRQWSKERGNQRLHLGGGLGGREDNLFRFKAGFSPLRATFSTSRLIIHSPCYGQLTQRWKTNHPSSEIESSDYFPRYRQAA